MTPTDEVNKKIAKIYAAALKQAVKDERKFKKIIKKVEEGKITAPQWYIDRGLEGKWYNGWVVQEMRNQGIIDSCARELAKAGSDAAKTIIAGQTVAYSAARDNAVKTIMRDCKRFGYNPAFYGFNKREISILVSAKTPPLSKITFRNMKNAEPIKRKLEQSFGKALALGTGRDKLVQETVSNLSPDAFVDGIMDSARQQEARARRICQTEMTRIESEAAYDVDEEALDQGIELEREWHCRFQNSRDSHIFLEGQTVIGDAPFISGDGNELRFPGDPLAPPEDTINCHCEVTSRAKSQSPELAKLRERTKKKREDWISKQIDSGEFNRWRNERDENGDVTGGEQTWR